VTHIRESMSKNIRQEVSFLHALAQRDPLWFAKTDLLSVGYDPLFQGKQQIPFVGECPNCSQVVPCILHTVTKKHPHLNSLYVESNYTWVEKHSGCQHVAEAKRLCARCPKCEQIVLVVTGSN